MTDKERKEKQRRNATIRYWGAGPILGKEASDLIEELGESLIKSYEIERKKLIDDIMINSRLDITS